MPTIEPTMEDTPIENGNCSAIQPNSTEEDVEMTQPSATSLNTNNTTPSSSSSISSLSTPPPPTSSSDQHYKPDSHSSFFHPNDNSNHRSFPASTTSIPSPPIQSQTSQQQQQQQQPSTTVNMVSTRSRTQKASGSGAIAGKAREASPNDRKSLSPISKAPARKTRIKLKTSTKAPRKWTPEELLRRRDSPVTRTDLRALLCNPMAWDALNSSDKEELIALFPTGTPMMFAGEERQRVDMGILFNSDNFNHDCAMYRENIRYNRHNEEWLAQAFSATELRKAGEFKDYLDWNFTQEWGFNPPAPLVYNVDDFESDVDELAAADDSGDKTTASTFDGSLFDDGDDEPTTSTIDYDRSTIGDVERTGDAGDKTD